MTQQPRWWRALLSTFRRWSGRKQGQKQQSVEKQVLDVPADYPYYHRNRNRNRKP